MCFDRNVQRTTHEMLQRTTHEMLRCTTHEMRNVRRTRCAMYDAREARVQRGPTHEMREARGHYCRSERMHAINVMREARGHSESRYNNHPILKLWSLYHLKTGLGCGSILCVSADFDFSLSTPNSYLRLATTIFVERHTSKDDQACS